MDKKSIKIDQKSTVRNQHYHSIWSWNTLKTDQKGTRKGQKGTRKEPKNHQKWTKNGSKMNQ